MSTRRWFARKKIIIRSEAVAVEVASPPDFTRNGVQVAVITDVSPPLNFVYEGVAVNLIGGNIGPLSTPVNLIGPTIPPTTDGISVNAGRLQLTKKGLYWIKLRVEVSDECNLFCVMKLNGFNFDGFLTHVPTLGGSIRYGSFIFQLAIQSDSVNIIDFDLSGDTLPIPGGPLSQGGTGILIINHWNFS